MAKNYYEQLLGSLVVAGEQARSKAAKEAAKPQLEITDEKPLTFEEALDRRNSQAIIDAANPYTLPAQDPHRRELQRQLAPKRESTTRDSH